MNYNKFLQQYFTADHWPTDVSCLLASLIINNQGSKDQYIGHSRFFILLLSWRLKVPFEEIKFLWVHWHCFTEASKMTQASGLRSCTLHICNIWQSLFNGGTQGRNFMIRCSFIKRKNCQQGIERGYWEERAAAAVKEETLAVDNIFFV